MSFSVFNGCLAIVVRYTEGLIKVNESVLPVKDVEGLEESAFSKMQADEKIKLSRATSDWEHAVEDVDEEEIDELISWSADLDFDQ